MTEKTIEQLKQENMQLREQLEKAQLESENQKLRTMIQKTKSNHMDRTIFSPITWKPERDNVGNIQVTNVALSDLEQIMNHLIKQGERYGM